MKISRPAALAIASVTLILIGCDNSLQPVEVDSPTFAVTSNTKTFFGPFLFPNACTGETLEFTGTRHDLFRVTNDGNGGFHIGFHRNWQNLRAMGLVSGNEYRAQQVINQSFNIQPPFPSSATFSSRLQFISKGPSDNFFSIFRTKMIVNANGDVTVSDVVSEVECR